MNKAAKRATQKHRANAKRYALRRKAEQQAAGSKPKAAAAPARTRAPKPAGEPAETENA